MPAKWVRGPDFKTKSQRQRSRDWTISHQITRICNSCTSLMKLGWFLVKKSSLEKAITNCLFESEFCRLSTFPFTSRGWKLVVETFSKTPAIISKHRKVTSSWRCPVQFLPQPHFRLSLIAFTHLNMLGTGKFGNMEFEEIESEWFQMYPGTF